MSARQRVESCCPPDAGRSQETATLISRSRTAGTPAINGAGGAPTRNAETASPLCLMRWVVTCKLATSYSQAVPGAIGKTAAWTLAGSMRTKSHTLPVSGGAALTSFDVGSKRHRIGRRAPHPLPVNCLRLQRRVCLCPKRPKRTGNYCRRPRLTDPEEPPLLGYRTMRRPNRTAAYQVGPSSHRSPHGDPWRRPPPPREAAGRQRWLEKLPRVSSVHSFEDQCALEKDCAGRQF